jgi:HEAT repeat protein
MADAPTLSPEVSRGVSTLARTLVAAARSWALYPSDHPAVRGSLDRLRSGVTEASAGQIFTFGVTPETLLVAGIPVGGRDAGAIAEAARWLHDRDILQMTFAGEVSVVALQKLLGVLSEDSRVIRRRGGPAKVWSEEGDAAISVQQIDFSQVLEDREVTNPVRRKDDLWRSIIRGVLDRRKPTDEATQARLLEISGDVVAIGELASDVIAPHHTMDGSPMLTSQAAAVVAAYRHLVGIVDVLSPERRNEVMQNLAAATANLNPHVVMQMLAGEGLLEAPGGGPGGPGETDGGGVVAGVVEAMDDNRVAQLLATTLAIEGQASARLATVFNTIATDEDRKTRVLSLTRRLLSETDFGRQDAFQSLWSSMEELLLTYNERPFVSASYRTGLDAVGIRAEQMASEVPADLLDLMDTLGQDNVRRLSVRLLIDLLMIEKDRARAPELARDVAALTEDLLLAGDYESTLAVVTALQSQAADSTAVTSQASRLALDGVVSTAPFVETAETLGDMGAPEARMFADICARIGPAATDALKTHLEPEAETPGRKRATAIIREFGPRAVGRLASVVGSNKWTAQRNAAELLGEIGAAEGVPLLQPLLRGHDPRVTTAAVRALSNIKDPAAAKAVHTVLRAATGDQRRAVVGALVAQRDARVVPVLVRILDDSDPFGSDHPLVLDTLAALSQVGDDQAVPALSTLMRKKKLFARSKTRALKEQSLTALRAIKTPAALGAIEEAAKTGDRMLRKLARAGG